MHVVIQGWSGPGFLARLGIVLITGLTWAVHAVQKIVVQPDYVNPDTPGDYFTVYAYSASLLLTSASLLTLRDATVPHRESSSAIRIVALACAVAGVANGLEDGFGLRAFGLLYVVGVLVAAGGMIVIAVMLWGRTARSLALVPALGGLAVMAVNIGGGLIGLVAWLGFGVILARERLKPHVEVKRPETA